MKLWVGFSDHLYSFFYYAIGTSLWPVEIYPIDLCVGLLNGLLNTYEFFIMLATIISIINILTINVFQKSKQVGILKAMGLTDLSASLVFFYQALLLSLLGIALSLGFLVVFLRGFNQYIVTDQGLPVVNVSVDYRFIGLSILIFFVVSMSTAIFPALRCIKLNPIEVIKNA